MTAVWEAPDVIERSRGEQIPRRRTAGRLGRDRIERGAMTGEIARSMGTRHRRRRRLAHQCFLCFRQSAELSVAAPFPARFPHMPSSKTPLEDLRQRIDEVDDRLHDLLMERTQLVEAIAAEKKEIKVPPLRAGREAMILRRLAARHTGRFPTGPLVRMWREMLAATVGMQTKFAVAVFTPSEGAGYWDLARDHFGSHTAMVPYQSVGQVIRAITDRQASIGILPMPQEDDPDPWWRFFVASDESAPRVLARLPFAGRGNARADGGDALAVGSGTLEPTGDDCSLIVVETRGEISRARIFSGLAAGQLACTFFAAFKPTDDTTLNLMQLTDFVLPDDPRLAQFAAHIGTTASVDRIVSLGSYANPLAPSDAAAPRQARP
jgi:chorismate mutase/prephenate dehydratase